jgi:hypothetical protein
LASLWMFDDCSLFQHIESAIDGSVLGMSVT